jgi:hypothetical protein
MRVAMSTSVFSMEATAEGASIETGCGAGTDSTAKTSPIVCRCSGGLRGGAHQLLVWSTGYGSDKVVVACFEEVYTVRCTDRSQCSNPGLSVSRGGAACNTAGV